MKNILALVLSICVAINSFAQVDTKSNLSDKDKIWGLSKFWSEVSYNFAYFNKTNINWDSSYQAFIPKVLATTNTWDYYRVLKQFAALLKDGHTEIWEPSSLYNKTSRYKWIRIEHINKHFYVENIGVADKDKAPIGSEVISINGVPAAQYAQENLFPYIATSTEHVLWNIAALHMFYSTDTTDNWKLILKTPDGKTVPFTAVYHTYPNVWVKNQPQWKRSDFKMIGDIAYFQPNTFGDAKILEDFNKVLPEIKKAKAVIIDIRGNGGGSSGIGAGILKHFTDVKIITGSTWKTKDNLGAFRAWGQYYSSMKNPDSLSEFERKAVNVYRGNYWFQGDTMSFENDVKETIKTPLAILIGNNTASAAEDFLIMVSELKNRAVTIGQPTYGSTGQPLQFEMPGGGGARVCTKKDTYPSGKEFVGYGIQPDILVERDINESMKGEDRTLDVAIRELKKKIK